MLWASPILPAQMPQDALNTRKQREARAGAQGPPHPEQRPTVEGVRLRGGGASQSRGPLEPCFPCPPGSSGHGRWSSGAAPTRCVPDAGAAFLSVIGISVLFPF